MLAARGERRAGPETEALRRWSAAAAVCVIAAFHFSVVLPRLSHKTSGGPTTVSLEPDAVIWTSGESWRNPVARLLEMRLDRHAAAGFDAAPVAVATKLMESVAGDRRPQYFLAQNVAMMQLASRASAFGTLQLAGKVFGVDAYKIVPRR